MLKKLKKELQKYILLDGDLNVLHEAEKDVQQDIPYSYIIANDGSLHYVKYKDQLVIHSLDAINPFVMTFNHAFYFSCC